MKANIKNTFMAVAAVLILGSCSEGQYWTEPTDKGQVIAFVKPAESISVAPTENLDSYTLKVYRSQTEGDLDVNLSFSNDSTVFSAPASVHFNNGENCADFVIAIAPLTPGDSYSTTVSVTEPEGILTHPDSRNTKFTLSVTKILSWSSLGTGYFYDGWVMGDVDAYPVEIMKVDGLERYRVMNPYKAYYASELGQAEWADWIASSGPQYVEFWENEDGKLSFQSFNTGLLYEGVAGQVIGAYSWTAFGEGSKYTGDNDMWYEPGFAVLSPVYYINGLGGFGQIDYSIQIELPK